MLRTTLYMTGLLIVLVLMILTVDINIAGPSITLNSTQYGADSDVIIGGSNADTAVYPAFTIAKKDKFEWITADQLSSVANYAENSSILSQYMLDTYSNHSDKDIRFAAYIFGDVIPLNLTVDWTYVKDNIQLFTDIVAQATGGDLAFGNELIDYQALLRTSNITEAILQQQLEAVLANTNGTVISLNQTRADVVNYLIEQFGFTTDQAETVADTVIEARDAAGIDNSNNNSTDTAVNSTALAEYIAGRLNNSDVTFAYDAATLDADTLDITLTNVTVSATTDLLLIYTVFM
jgi:stringent starvation protein B